MSGHSKWSTIKRKKAKVDAERSKIFTKVIKEIVVAAREGGGDPVSNTRLRTAVQSARENNVPAANIEKAIKRGTGELPGVTYESCTFEGYGPGGVAVLVESLTDNRNRTSAEVRHIFSKHGGHLGEPNSVSWMFEQKGIIVIEGALAPEETVLEISLENGADDVRSEGGVFEVVSSTHAYETLREKFLEKGIKPQLSEIGLYPKNTVQLDREHAARVLKLVNALEDNDDVQQVSANFDIPDEILREIESEL
ncbi:MAG TPA: YebC/PmpR family DNA-binding transcriptional regulator [Candidatus Eisenbacteria bacterium]|uniref:Probable transcriptional regulatory protein ENO08_01905 n=1 Tax=Eiseniibacteriota bacterium TaxID=2212470 RepID=A0A7V2ATX5_UNCEI|nr:YebC/PmpR family DNA-binding transcriptional regulator [Candidatus Eisenbacteria bacterium]